MLNLDTFEHHHCGPRLPKFESAVYSKLPQELFRLRSRTIIQITTVQMSLILRTAELGRQPLPSSRSFCGFYKPVL